jgi:hypothetical protein
LSSKLGGNGKTPIRHMNLIIMKEEALNGLRQNQTILF